MVLDALECFSPEMSKMAKSVFDAGHVDSQTRAGKRDGAFCATIRPDILPYDTAPLCTKIFAIAKLFF